MDRIEEPSCYDGRKILIEDNRAFNQSTNDHRLFLTL
jgi:hypothetical protein